MGLTAECNMKNECLRIAEGALKVKNQRPLAPSNLRGGANMQWDKGMERIIAHEFPNYETKKEYMKNECFRIAEGAVKVKNQRPLAPSNLRGGANVQWARR